MRQLFLLNFQRRMQASMAVSCVVLLLMRLPLRRPPASKSTHLWSFIEARSALGDMVCKSPLPSRAFAFLMHYLAIQLAKCSGFYPTITTSSAKHADDLKSLVALYAIDRNVSAIA